MLSCFSCVRLCNPAWREGGDRMTGLDGITNSMDMNLSNSRNWWWAGKPGMLQSMGHSQTQLSDWTTATWTVARQTPLSMGFSRQGHWRRLPCPPPGDLPDPGIEPESLTFPALPGVFFTTSTTWEAPIYSRYIPNFTELLIGKQWVCW